MNFNDYYWHDSVLEAIVIDRQNPGNIDEIQMKINWYTQETSILIFKNVYWASFNLNFGFIGSENILFGSELDQDDPDLLELYRKRKGHVKNLKVFFIELNTSGGKIKIIAENFINKNIKI